MNFKPTWLLGLLCLFMSISVNATHYLGNEIRYKYLGGNTYQVDVVYYTDCHHGDRNAISQDNPVEITVFSEQSGGSYRMLSNTTLRQSQAPVGLADILGQRCLNNDTDACVERTVYSGNFDLPANTTPYMIAGARCCLVADASNIDNPGNQGLTMMIQVPSSANAVNSSPVFFVPPPVRLNVNKVSMLNCSASDADGDSLVYRLAPIYAGGTSNDAKPQLYDLELLPLVFKGGASAMNPLYGAGMLNVSASTGIVTVMCREEGRYIFAIACDEYRKGTLLNTATRTFIYEFGQYYSTQARLEGNTDITTSLQDSILIAQCNGNYKVKFINKSVGATSYSWDFGDPSTTADVSALPEPEYTYPGPGKYPVTFIAHGAACADTLRAYVLITDDEVVPDFTVSGKLCTNSPIVVTDNSILIKGTVKKYLWAYEGLTKEGVSATFMPATAGSHPMIHTIVTEKGCVVSSSQNTDIYKVNLVASNDTLVVKGGQLTLSASGATQYEWSPEAYGTNTLSNRFAANTVLSCNESGVYSFTVKGTDNNNCYETETVKVTIAYIPYVFMPTAFTPNGDGRNDILKPTTAGAARAVFKVFNRKGRVVFETNDLQSGWNGTYKGEPLDAGVYFWMIKVNEGNGLDKVYKGDVTLIR